MSADVTSTADTPDPERPGGHGEATDESGGSAGRGGPAAPLAGATRIPQSALRRRVLRHRALRVLAAGSALLVMASGGAAWYAYKKLDGNIRTDEGTARMLGDYESERPQEIATEATNILLIGSDDRSGANAQYGGDGGSQRSDTTILLHLSADRSRATAVSIPRDLMAQIPACARPEGGETRPQFAQFNWAFQFGGAACTIRTVENMTGVRINHHMIVDFTGFKRMVDAVGGVEVCLPAPVKDRDAKLDLPAGRQTVKGEDALAYVRARHSFGDGSDTQRIGRQQQFLGSLVNKVKSSGVLLNPARLYPLLDAATSSITADAGLDSLSELYGLARSLRKTDADAVGFLTVPRQPYVNDRNRDQLLQPAADDLFAALREDRPVTVDKSPGLNAPAAEGPAGSPSTAADGQVSQDANDPQPPAAPGVSPSPSASEPAFPGTTANGEICGTR